MRISDWSSDVCSSDLQDDLLHRGSQARLDPPAADLTATAVNKTRRRVEQIALRNLDDIELDSDAFGYDGLAPGSGRTFTIAGGARVCAYEIFVLFEEKEEDRSEAHTSELQSLMRISYAVFC